MSAIASRITSLTTVYFIVYSRADRRKHQRSASLALVRGIHRRPVNSPHKGPVTRKMVPFDDVIMNWTIADVLSIGSQEQSSMQFNSKCKNLLAWQCIKNAVCRMSTLLIHPDPIVLIPALCQMLPWSYRLLYDQQIAISNWSGSNDA